MLVHEDNPRLQVQSVNLVHTLLPFQCPVHLLRILGALLSPCGFLKIHARRLYRELCVNNEREDCLVTPIDCDIGGDVVAQWEPGRQLPFILGKTIDLAAAVLTPSEHQQSLTVAAAQHASSGPHRVIRKVRHRR